MLLQVKPIDRFDDEHRFLSNFWPAAVQLDGYTYPTVEHAYQAAKTLSAKERTAIAMIHPDSPGRAKQLGRKVTKRKDWEQIKLSVMLTLLRQKFAPGTGLARQLLATGNSELIEGNNWGDMYWGRVEGVGLNHLGRLLMQVREELREEDGLLKESTR